MWMLTLSLTERCARTRCWGRCYKMIHIWCECWPYPWQSGARLTRCWGRCYKIHIWCECYTLCLDSSERPHSMLSRIRYKMIHIWCECIPYPWQSGAHLTRCWGRCSTFTYDVNVDHLLDRAVRASLDAEVRCYKWYTYDVNVDLILDRAVRAIHSMLRQML